MTDAGDIKVLAAHAPYDALMGTTSDRRGLEPNALWRSIVGPGNRVRHAELAEVQARQGE